jgi:N-acetylglucosamine-6-phosphate deacetylase
MRLQAEILLGGDLVPGSVEIDGDSIVAVAARERRGERVEGVLAASLCDLQVNGAAGFEVTGGHAALDAIDRALLERGVTRYLATIAASDDETASGAVADLEERAADPASPVEGIHLEGPFLSSEFPGVHRLERLRVPAAGVPAYYRSPAVRMVTLAPELPGALELTRELSARGVLVAIGHSDASPAVAEQAVAAGARAVTHVFNGMRPFHHRRPTLPAWALQDERVTVSVIPDGFHVDRIVLRLVRRAAAARVVLVSDAAAGAGAPDGRYELAGVEVESRAGRTTTADGALAGSAITLDEGVRRWMTLAGANLAEALVAAGERPARLLGLAGIDVGAAADLVVVDGGGRVAQVMRRGRWIT